jgi:NAD(P)-dependent dehydrogenase (short-subunit alcohol dehydrogenase family)
MAELPAHFGLKFTPTIHSQIPPNIDPTKVTLPKPFIVVVTGAGKGLGYHISLAFAKAGCSGISISSRTQSDLDELEIKLKEIAKEKGVGIEVLKSVCDVQDASSVQALAESVRNKWGRVDVVIANAGIISKYIEKKGEGDSNLPVGIVEDEDWARVLNINVNGVWRISTLFLFPFPSLGKTRTLTPARQSVHAPPAIDKRWRPNTYLLNEFGGTLDG